MTKNRSHAGTPLLETWTKEKKTLVEANFRENCQRTLDPMTVMPADPYASRCFFSKKLKYYHRTSSCT